MSGTRQEPGNAQLNLRAGSEFRSRHPFFSANALGALRASRSSPNVRRAPFVTEHARVDAASIIPDPYLKLAFVHTGFPLLSRRARALAKCIAQAFPCNPVDFVPQHRMQVPAARPSTSTKKSR